MMSTTEAAQMSHVGLGHLDVLSMSEVRRVGGGVERRKYEHSRAGTPNNRSSGGAVYLDGWLMFG